MQHFCRVASYFQMPGLREKQVNASAYELRGTHLGDNHWKQNDELARDCIWWITQTEQEEKVGTEPPTTLYASLTFAAATSLFPKANYEPGHKSLAQGQEHGQGGMEAIRHRCML